MALGPRETNLSLDDVLIRINDLLSKNGWSDRAFLVESVFSSINGGLNTTFAVVRPDEEGIERTLNSDFLDYGRIILSRERTALNELEKKLREIQSQGRFTVSNVTGIAQSGGHWTAESYPGG